MITLDDLISALDHDLRLAEQQDSALFLRQETQLEKMHKFVLVRIDSHHLAIPIEGLAEIGPMPKITPLPNLPKWLHGIINHRGDIVSVSDFTLLLDDRAELQRPKSRLAILHDQEGIMTGFGIDQVFTTVSLPESAWAATSQSRLYELAPEVFGHSLALDESQYTILNVHAFFRMGKLMRYDLVD